MAVDAVAALDDRRDAEAERKQTKANGSGGTVTIKIVDGEAEAERPVSSSSGDGSVTVTRVSAVDQAAGPAVAEPPAKAEQELQTPPPLVNPDTASSVDDLLEK